MKPDQRAPDKLKGLSLPVFDHVPPSCELRVITDDASLPHLKPGEFAVIDRGDCNPAEGALFEIQFQGGSRAIVELWPRKHYNERDGSFIGWWHGRYNRPRSLEDADVWRAEGRVITTVDGPLLRGDMGEMLRGRVIGVYGLRAEAL